MTTIFRIRTALAAFARRAAHHLTAPWCVERRYARPPAGWSGWVEGPGRRTLAFRTVDGRLTYRW